MYSQACCLFYLVSGSLPTYSQAHCLCILRLAALGILRLTAYLVSGSLPTYSQAHCLCILRLAAYVFSGSLPTYSQAHRLTAHVFLGLLPI